MSKKYKSIAGQYSVLAALLISAAVMWVIAVAAYDLFDFEPGDLVKDGGLVDDSIWALRKPMSITVVAFVVISSGIAALLLRSIETKVVLLKGAWRHAANVGVAAVYSATAYSIAGIIGLYNMGVVPHLRTKADLFPYLSIFGMVCLFVPFLVGVWLALPDDDDV